MKHKVGDVVRIKSLDWYNEKREGHPNIIITSSITFTKEMSSYCGKKLKIKSVRVWGYFLDIGKESKTWCWTDDMFEEGIRLIKKKNPKEPIVISKNYILSDKLTYIEELDELEKNKECVAWYNSDTSIYTIWSAFLVKNWSYRVLEKELSNIYKVIRNDNANVIVEALSKENIINGENVQKAIDITRKILNKNE